MFLFFRVERVPQKKGNLRSRGASSRIFEGRATAFSREDTIVKGKKGKKKDTIYRERHFRQHLHNENENRSEGGSRGGATRRGMKIKDTPCAL